MVKRKKENEITQISLAKINLFLDTISRRNDGFYNIKSILTEICLEDNLIFRLTESGTIKVSCSSNDIKNEDNIVFKIASFLKDKYNVRKGLNIILEKNIPISAGLGGGSSNAALTIRICNRLWNLQLSEVEMNKVAEQFGSDINFFLKGGMAYASGKGEKVSNIPTKLRIENLLLVNPGISISSGKAYSWIKPENERCGKLEKIKEAIATNDIAVLCQNMYNSLEDGVFLHYPIIKKIKEKMLDLGAVGSLMSGSGSTVFGVFDSKDKMELAKRYFKDLDFWTLATKPLDYKA